MRKPKNLYHRVSLDLTKKQVYAIDALAEAQFKATKIAQPKCARPKNSPTASPAEFLLIVCIPSISTP